MADIKKLAKYGKALRAAGMAEPEIRAAVDSYEARLDSEQAEADSVERAKPGVSARDLEAHNLERYSRGLAPMLPAEEDEALAQEQNQPRAFTPEQIRQMTLTREFENLPPLTAAELAAMQIQRLTPKQPEPEPKPDRAKMSAKAAAYRQAQRVFLEGHGVGSDDE